MGIWSNIKWGLTVQSFSLDRFTGFKGHQNDKRMWSGGHVDWPSEELVHISMVEDFWHIWETTTSRIQKKIQYITIFFFTQTSTKCKAKARSKDTLKLEWNKLPIHFWNAPKIHLHFGNSRKMTKIGCHGNHSLNKWGPPHMPNACWQMARWKLHHSFGLPCLPPEGFTSLQHRLRRKGHKHYLGRSTWKCRF